MFWTLPHLCTFWDRRHEISCMTSPALSRLNAAMTGLRTQWELLPEEPANPLQSWLLVWGVLMQRDTGFGLMPAAGETSEDRKQGKESQEHCNSCFLASHRRMNFPVWWLQLWWSLGHARPEHLAWFLACSQLLVRAGKAMGWFGTMDECEAGWVSELPALFTAT